MSRKLYLYVKAFSDLGTFMDTIVLNALIFSLTGSAAWLSGSLAASVFGGFVSSLYSGIVADRFDRRKVMVVADLLRAVLLLLIIPFPTPLTIVAARFLIGMLGPFFSVSFQSEVPNMFGEDKALETNALISRLGSLCMLAGFLGGGLISERFGYEVVLTLDALSFIVSALVLMRMRWDTPKTRSVPTEPSRSIWRTVAADLREVKAYLAVRPVLLIVFVSTLIVTFGASSHNLGFPLLAAVLEPANSTFVYGLIWGVWGIGNVLTSLLLPRLHVVRRNMHLTYYITTVLMSVGFICIFSAQTLPWALVAAFGTGVFDAFAVTLNATIMQQTENHMRGRVFGVSSLVNRLGFGVGFLVAPLVMERAGLSGMVYVLHGLIIAVTFIAIAVYLMVRGKGVGNDGRHSQAPRQSA